MKTICKKGNSTLVVIVTGDEDSHVIMDTLPFSFLQVISKDWDAQLSPWPAENVFPHARAFAGGADAFLNEIMNNDVLQQKWKHKIICGYSLAGLFALYACTKGEWFEGCASVSGSMWFPNFVDYVKRNPVYCKKVYLSLGDQEERSRNAYLKQVTVNTKEMADLLKRDSAVTFEMNEGNHFKDPEERIIKALSHFI